MKKLFSLIAAVAISATVSAQAPQGLAQSKISDNWYIGVQGGVVTKTTGQAWMKNLDYNGALRLGKWISPVFGLQAEGTAYFNSSSKGNFVDAVNVGLNTTWNFSNLFAGYKGEPRCFEIIGIYGLGWMHGFAPGGKDSTHDGNVFSSKAGIDFAYNFGSDKQWQAYLEPSIVWALSGCNKNLGSDFGLNPTYNINRSMVQLNAGIVYKFGCSNGTHNFKLVDLKDQAEIDALNTRINDLRSEANTKDAEIARLKKALSDCENKPAPKPVVIEKKVSTKGSLMPKVIFRCGNSNIDPAQVANVEMIAKYMQKNPDAKVLIKGYASPEGPADLNQRLSEKRAEVVKNMLVKKYGIAEDRLSTEGCGPTDTLSDVVDFNRVATFNDTTL